MSNIIKVSEIILALLYTGAAYHYIRDFIKPTPKTALLCRMHILGIPVVHVIYLTIVGLAFNRSPVASFYEFLSALALGLLVIYFYLEARFKTRTLGPWIVGLAAILQTAAAIFVRHPNPSPEQMVLFQSMWFTFHMIFGSLAYASLLTSMIFSILYLVLYRHLKRKIFGLFFERFLPLSVLGDMNYQAMVAGVMCLALMIPFGIGMVYQYFGKWIWDIKYLSVFLIFLVYFIGVLIGRYAGWRGNRLALYSLFGMTVLILTMAVSMLGSANHRWI